MGNELFTGYSHVGIYVQNREKAIEFYETVLGFKLLYKVDNGSDGLHIAMLQLNNCVVEVLEPPKELTVLPPQCAWENIPGNARATANHLGITVTDIEKAMEWVRSFGFEFEDRDIYDVPNFGSEKRSLKVAFFRGPNGERIELFQEFMK